MDSGAAMILVHDYLDGLRSSYATPFYLCRMESKAAMLCGLNINSYDIGSQFCWMDSEVAMLYLFLNLWNGLISSSCHSLFVLNGLRGSYATYFCLFSGLRGSCATCYCFCLMDSKLAMLLVPIFV